MKITMELEGSQFKYSVEICESSRFAGERPQDLSIFGLFTDVGRALEKEFLREDKWKEQLRDIRNLVAKEEEVGKIPDDKKV